MGSHTAAKRRRRPQLATETILLLAAILLVTLANGEFWRGALAGREPTDPWTWGFGAAVLVGLTALHFLALALIVPRRMVRPMLAALIVVSVLANHFMQRYGVVLDPSMLRSVLRTDSREAAELVTAATLRALLLGMAAAALLWMVQPRVLPMRRALLLRLSCTGLSLITATVAILVVYQDLGPLMRVHKNLRYTITPANVAWSLGQVLAGDARAMTLPRDPPEPARRRLTVAAARKPTLLVLVVGETARAANFSLNGYERATNPELARLGVINFPHTVACGTSTEVSVPCMFSPFGRADFDEARIRRHESLLHLLGRAGFRVVWLDNQSGCKGVCDGLELRDLSRSQVHGLCAEERCYDEVLTRGLVQVVQEGFGDLIVVLHQLGNHGPAYFRRYPPDYKRFTPACERNDLRGCTRDEIINAYDNALVYTDHVLADTIRFLEKMSARFDVGLLYVSDHGESLGEMGLYLHGLPYALAPREQLEVPMLWWFGPGAAATFDVDLECFRGRSARAASHDNLYHSVLGLLAVDTPRYRPERDLFADCRNRKVAHALPARRSEPLDGRP